MSDTAENRSQEVEEGLTGDLAPSSPLEPSELECLRSELEIKKQSEKEQTDRYLRILADFENYKKRIQKDQADQAKFANERLIKELLTVSDNLERALNHSKETRDFDKMVEGVDLIYKNFHAAISKFGVAPIHCLNLPFNPAYHQAVGQVEVPDSSDDAENKIVNEIQKGYFLYERVLRHSLVIISKKGPSSTEQTPEAS